MKFFFSALLIAISGIVFNAAAAPPTPLIGTVLDKGGQTPQDVAYLHTWKTIEVAVRSGSPAKIRNYVNTCNDDGRPAVSGTANHGAVTFRDGTANACGHIRPVTEMWYLPDSGFHGVDEITVGAPFYEGINVTVR